MAQARRDDLHYCQLHHEVVSYRGLWSEIKRIVSGNEVSYLQQIQGGQQCLEAHADSENHSVEFCRTD